MTTTTTINEHGRQVLKVTAGFAGAAPIFEHQLIAESAIDRHTMTECATEFVRKLDQIRDDVIEQLGAIGVNLPEALKTRSTTPKADVVNVASDDRQTSIYDRG